MTPMNNPVMSLVQMMKGGGNPNALLNMLAQRNPQVAQVMQMTQGKSPSELEQIARNMCRERGVTVEDMAKQLGLDMPNQ